MCQPLYVYALMRPEDAGLFDHGDVPDLPAVAAPDQHVRCLDLGRICAVVSAIDAHEVMSTRRNMLTHAKVLEAVMDAQTILPVRFGVISATEADLRATVEPEAERLREVLAGLDGKIEMGLKARCDEAAVMRAIVAERPDLAARYQKLQAGDPDAVQFQKVDLGREVAALRGEWRDAQRAALARRFDDICEQIIIHEPDDDDLLVFNAAFLLPREREPELLARVEAIDGEYGDAMTLTYVGPAPVYNFVSIRLNWTPPTAPAAANLNDHTRTEAA